MAEEPWRNPDYLQPSETLPVSPSLQIELDEEGENEWAGILDLRAVTISGIAIGIALAATVCAKALVLLIAFVTNLAFFGRLSFAPSTPAHHHLGPWVIVIPAIGGLIVGYMARYGSRAIRGHGIPEAMEQVLTNASRIPPRITFLKPASSAVAIGTGGPFGAEGPIIATGGALGSLVGQLLHTTGIERKTLLASGAAAGMTAIFGSPVSAVILAIELLLFEMRPRTVVPVALACATAAGLRTLFMESGPVFPMPTLAPVPDSALVFYVLLGFVVGVVATGVTRLVYGIEDAFERLPIHWMWWPALGGLAVGLVGYFAPRTLGVGYNNIADVLNGRLTGAVLLVLGIAKFVSWSIALGSGTSGGTLAPLLTVGGALGSLLGTLFAPHLGIDPRIAGLVGMAAMFAGASRALLTSVVFAFETTQQPASLLPLLGGCAAAYLASCLLMKNTIMTEKIARRGVRVPNEYVADLLDHVTVGSVGRRSVVTLEAQRTVAGVREWLRGHGRDSEHQGFPVVDAEGRLAGVVTRRNLLDPAIPEETLLSSLIRRPAVTLGEEATLRDAADRMIKEGIGRLPILDRNGEMVGIITRSDLLSAHQTRLTEHEERERTIRPRKLLRDLRNRKAASGLSGNA
ncbi:CBS domain-containing protein [bacterium]|nr:MAG: CBS domain-containing protein [bacterium]